MSQSSNNGHTYDPIEHLFYEWLLTPEGAAIHRGEPVAVVADLHLGYEWARGAAGDSVIAHSLDETLSRLAAIFERARVTRLIVAGDLVESPRPCRRTEADVRRLREWLTARGVSLLAVEGNHDRSLANRLSVIPGGRGSVRAERRRGSPGGMPSQDRAMAFSPIFEQLRPADSMPMTCTVAGWTIGHGHRPIRGARTISGHHHPVLRVDRTSAPCFLVGPERIVLPAFSTNAAGCDVARASLPAEWRGRALRCIVSTGSELLDFGTLFELRRGLRLRRT